MSRAALAAVALIFLAAACESADAAELGPVDGPVPSPSPQSAPRPPVP